MDSALVATTVGGVLALAGSFLGQWWGERRAVERERRALAHEARTWARAQRCEAYITFLMAFRDLFDDVLLARLQNVPTPAAGAYSSLLDRLTIVGVFGSGGASAMAEALCGDLLAFGSDPMADPRTTNFMDLLEDFKAEVRTDLEIPA